MTAVTVRQFASSVQSGSVTLGSAPLSGSLLIAMTPNWNDVPAATGWTRYEQDIAGNTGTTILYKYAGASESATQTPTTTTNIMLGVWEVEGTDLSFALAFQARLKADTVSQASNAYTTGTITTASADTVALIMLGAGVPTSVTQTSPVVGTGQTDDGSQVNNTSGSRHWGATFSHEAFPTSGSTVQYTATWSSTQEPNDGWYYILLLNAAYVPLGPRVSAVGVEVLNSGHSSARVSAVGAEILNSGHSTARVSMIGIEVLRSISESAVVIKKKRRLIFILGLE